VLEVLGLAGDSDSHFEKFYEGSGGEALKARVSSRISRDVDKYLWFLEAHLQEKG
jgi:hypothetical protein